MQHTAQILNCDRVFAECEVEGKKGKEKKVKGSPGNTAEFVYGMDQPFRGRRKKNKHTCLTNVALDLFFL